MSTYYSAVVRRYDNADSKVRIWVQGRGIAGGKSTGISPAEYPVYLEARGDHRGQAVALTRQEARDIIATLQAVLDRAGPEPKPPFDPEAAMEGQAIHATDAEKLPEGSIVLNLINRYRYEARDGGLISLPSGSNRGGVRLYAESGGNVLIERVGPEPIIEPEGTTSVIDGKGKLWHRKSNGLYNMTFGPKPDGSEYEGYTSFETLVRKGGMVRAMQAVELDVVEA